jgi:hypothetical protein
LFRKPAGDGLKTDRACTFPPREANMREADWYLQQAAEYAALSKLDAQQRKLWPELAEHWTRLALPASARSQKTHRRRQVPKTRQ